MTDTQTAAAPAPAPPQPGYTIEKWDQSWRLLDPESEMVCLTVYKKGATEVVRRLQHTA